MIFVHHNDYKTFDRIQKASKQFAGKVVTEVGNEDLKEYDNINICLSDILSASKRGISVQRYKGLGEMNPGQLWETTLDPKNRSLIQVKIDDEESTKGVFEDLMGENVLPRKEFIENRADKVVNLDI